MKEGDRKKVRGVLLVPFACALRSLLVLVLLTCVFLRVFCVCLLLVQFKFKAHAICLLFLFALIISAGFFLFVLCLSFLCYSGHRPLGVSLLGGVCLLLLLTRRAVSEGHGGGLPAQDR